MENINIIPAKVMSIENKSNDVYVCQGNRGIGTKLIHTPQIGGKVYSKDKPIIRGSGQSFQWQLSVPENSAIITPSSYIKYQIQFPMINLTYDITGIDTTATHGIYYVIDKTIYFQRAICTSSKFVSFADPVAIALWPMNSACIISETKTVYGNISHKDDNVAQQTILYQALLSEEYQAMNNRQWFDQSTDKVWEICTLDWDDAKQIYKWTDGKTNYTFYQTFTISLGALNSMFDMNNLFYASAFKKQTIQFNVKLQPHDIIKCFWTKTLFDPTLAGITEFELYIYCKEVDTIQSQLEDKKNLFDHYQRYDNEQIVVSTQGTCAPLLNGHTSSNQVILALTNNDIGNDDSTVLKQRFTLFNATQILNRRNGLTPKSAIFKYFYNLNLERGNADGKFFTDNLIDPIAMRHESLRSTNALTQFTKSDAQSLNTIMEMMETFAHVRIDLQAFSMESPENDVVGDGYKSDINRLRVRFDIRNYNLTEDTAEILDSTYLSKELKCVKLDVNSSYGCTSWQAYDSTIMLNTVTGALTDVELMGH